MRMRSCGYAFDYIYSKKISYYVYYHSKDAPYYLIQINITKQKNKVVCEVSNEHILTFRDTMSHLSPEAEFTRISQNLRSASENRVKFTWVNNIKLSANTNNEKKSLNCLSNRRCCYLI